MKKYDVYEDNAGGLYLIVYTESEKPEYFHAGYEQNPGQLFDDLEALHNGADPVNEWEGNEIENLPEFNKQLVDFPNNIKLVANEDEVFTENMGQSAWNELMIY